MGRVVSDVDCRSGRTVIIAPHPDDETIGCGGLLIKRKKEGHTTVIVVASRGQGPRLAECARALEGLNAVEIVTLDIEDGTMPRGDILDGAAASVSAILSAHAPSCVFVPNVSDIHPIHRCANTLAAMALRDSGLNGRCRVFQYEGFTPLADPNRWLDITAEMAEKKVRLGAYLTQQKKYSLTAVVESLNAYRGATLFRRGIEYAEAYRMMDIKEYLSCSHGRNC